MVDSAHIDKAAILNGSSGPCSDAAGSKHIAQNIEYIITQLKLVLPMDNESRPILVTNDPMVPPTEADLFNVLHKLISEGYSIESILVNGSPRQMPDLFQNTVAYESSVVEIYEGGNGSNNGISKSTLRLFRPPNGEGYKPRLDCIVENMPPDKADVLLNTIKPALFDYDPSDVKIRKKT